MACLGLADLKKIQNYRKIPWDERRSAASLFCLHENLRTKTIPRGRLKNPKATRLSSLKTQKEKSKAKSQEEPLGTPWDFYLYVALTLLN